MLAVSILFLQRQINLTGFILLFKIQDKCIGALFVNNAVLAGGINNLNMSNNSNQNDPQISKKAPFSLPYARVLVVDDFFTNHEILKGMLFPYDIQVDCLTSGQQAVDAIRSEKNKYNAIFMDHIMPVMDGIEAVRIIREEIGTEYARNIPIIAITSADDSDEQMFLTKGFQALLDKPIKNVLLDEIIRKWIWDEKLADINSNKK